MRIAIEDRLWFFKSPYESAAHPVTDCLTLSHGATTNQAGYFQVPANTKVHFFVRPGEPDRSPQIFSTGHWLQ
jgi:hypothetical protein